MRERPILFQGAMVRAILSGAKTQTRRLVKPEPTSTAGQYRVGDALQAVYGGHPIYCPYGHTGDRLWVREAHWWFKDEHDPVTGYYPPKLTAEDVEYRADGEKPGRVWRPSIHMHRWASRILLEVTDVRVERLQSISEADARAEGIEPYTNHAGRWLSGHRPGLNYPSAAAAYRDLWESINGAPVIERDDDGREIWRHFVNWEANPWVWAVSFRRITEPKETPNG